MKAKLLLLFLCFSVQIFAQLTIKVTSVPANTPAGDNIHIAGSFQGWNPGDVNSILTNNGDGTYQITITPPVGLIKYKFTRGSWPTVEGNAAAGFLPDREYNYTGGPVTETVSILSWEDLGGGGSGTAADNVYLLDENFYMPQLDRYRKIWIYLPPDYNSSSKHYPVLYMHDGQNLFDANTSFSGEWEVDESLNQLYNQGDHGAIVVGVENGGGLRIREYSPWFNSDYNDGGEGGKYVDFIVETLKPYIDQNYRTLPGREFTCLFGSSLGGLISQYGIMEHQDVIGKAGVFSPAFWFNPEIFDQAANTPKTQDMKIYFLAGVPEGNGSVVADVNQMYSALLNNGFENWELSKAFHNDGQHSEWYWAREFPWAYLWLFDGVDFTAASEQQAKKIRLRPNPTDSLLTIENLPELSRPTYQVFGLDGKLYGKGSLNGNTVDVANLPAGAYVLNILTKRKVTVSEKFVVKH
jgi:predicted alpha/beta superfamily hydrolase